MLTRTKINSGRSVSVSTNPRPSKCYENAWPAMWATVSLCQLKEQRHCPEQLQLDGCGRPSTRSGLSRTKPRSSKQPSIRPVQQRITYRSKSSSSLKISLILGWTGGGTYWAGSIGDNLHLLFWSCWQACRVLQKRCNIVKYCFSEMVNECTLSACSFSTLCKTSTFWSIVAKWLKWYILYICIWNWA